jgi:hypothetical protein
MVSSIKQVLANGLNLLGKKGTRIIPVCYIDFLVQQGEVDSAPRLIRREDKVPMFYVFKKEANLEALQKAMPEIDAIFQSKPSISRMGYEADFILAAEGIKPVSIFGQSVLQDTQAAIEVLQKYGVNL